jgi:hypothetical protein
MFCGRNDAMWIAFKAAWIAALLLRRTRGEDRLHRVRPTTRHLFLSL